MAERTLQGKRVAFLATDGVEEVELTEPWKAVREAGAEAVLLAPGRDRDRIVAFRHLDRGDVFHVDQPVEESRVEEFDALVLPGGVANPDQLRTSPEAVAFVRGFVEDGKPLGVICHGPWTLVEADVVRGLTMTSYPSVRTDLQNAGATWIDQEVVVDDGIVSSRDPDDLPAFCSKIVEEFAEGRHKRQASAGARAR
jgi:protease I